MNMVIDLNVCMNPIESYHSMNLLIIVSVFIIYEIIELKQLL